MPAGLALAGLLAGTAFVFALGGPGSRSRCAGRPGRARARGHLAAGGGARGGLREASRRVLGRLGRVLSVPEALRGVDAIALRGRLAAAGRSLAARLSQAPMWPVALLDAVLAWVVREASAYTPPPPAAPLRLRARPLDWALLASAAARLVLALEPFRAIVGG